MDSRETYSGNGNCKDITQNYNQLVDTSICDFITSVRRSVSLTLLIQINHGASHIASNLLHVRVLCDCHSIHCLQQPIILLQKKNRYFVSKK